MIPPRLAPLLATGTPTQTLAGRFDAAGHQLYLVGGSVRDAFLDQPTKDLDFATDARPPQIVEFLSGFAEIIFRVVDYFGTFGA